MTKFSDNERNNLKVQPSKFYSTYLDVRDIKIRVIKSFLLNIVHNDQGNKDFV